MASDLRGRVTALETRRGTGLIGGVVTMSGNETPEAALARSGRRGACLVMPPTMDVATWEVETDSMQRRLMHRAAAVAVGRPDPGTSPVDATA